MSDTPPHAVELEAVRLSASTLASGPSLLRSEHCGLETSSSFLDVVRGVQLVLLRLRFLKRRRSRFHILLRRLQINVLNGLKVIDQNRKLIRVHACKAAPC